MKRVVVASIVSAGVFCAASERAEACGGCFHEPPSVSESRNTQVTGHRMILAMSQTQTSLWDQIEYVGAPSEFAWVLPIKGQVEVGLSSDSLFASLDTATGVEIDSPVVMCGGSGGPGYSSGTCDGGASYNAAGSGGGSGGSDPISENEVAVEVVSHEVVGPYETVQL
ncbi:MAG TPA: DUF2330 domain-containing protein, partial [Polyangiaceae bacterium]|nr:DUF2330 domain-containing protein [Polyangiaceae bacterium]